MSTPLSAASAARLAHDRLAQIAGPRHVEYVKPVASKTPLADRLKAAK